MVAYQHSSFFYFDEATWNLRYSNDILHFIIYIKELLLIFNSFLLIVIKQWFMNNQSFCKYHFSVWLREMHFHASRRRIRVNGDVICTIKQQEMVYSSFENWLWESWIFNAQVNVLILQNWNLCNELETKDWLKWRKDI